MSEMRNLVFALLGLSAIITGMFTFGSAVYSEYGISNTENLTTFNYISNITTHTKNMSSALYEQPIEDPGPLDFVWTVSGNALDAITIMANIGNIYFNVLGDIQNMLYIPDWALDFIYICITVFIIFTIASAFMKWKV